MISKDRSTISPPGAADTVIQTNMDGCISCSQINLHHSVAAVHSLDEWLNSNSKKFLKIALIQEPYLSDNFQVKGFSKNVKIYQGKHNVKIRSCIVMSQKYASRDKMTTWMRHCKRQSFRKEIKWRKIKAEFKLLIWLTSPKWNSFTPSYPKTGISIPLINY